MAIVTKKTPLLLLPQLSEKASKLVSLNKYVFKVGVNSNKVEIRKTLEKQYGVKIVSINIVRSEGKTRRYGRSTGKMKDFKKAIVTLHPDSKKLDGLEQA